MQIGEGKVCKHRSFFDSLSRDTACRFEGGGRLWPADGFGDDVADLVCFFVWRPPLVLPRPCAVPQAASCTGIRLPWRFDAHLGGGGLWDRPDLVVMSSGPLVGLPQFLHVCSWVEIVLLARQVVYLSCSECLLVGLVWGLLALLEIRNRLSVKIW